jgi:cholesterol transport system auxiliary component
MNLVYCFRRSFTFFCAAANGVARWVAVGALTVVSLAGCSILPESTPQRVYQLPDAPVPSAHADIPADTAPSLRVLTPSSPLILASNRILVMSNPNELAAFKGVRWSDPMPQLFQRRLVSYLRESNNWRVVTADGTPLAGDYQLILSLAQFHAVRMPGQTPRVEIRVDAILGNRETNKAIAGRTFTETALAESEAFDALLNAYGEAGNVLAGKISAWAYQQTQF